MLRKLLALGASAVTPWSHRLSAQVIKTIHNDHSKLQYQKAGCADKKKKKIKMTEYTLNFNLNIWYCSYGLISVLVSESSTWKGLTPVAVLASGWARTMFCSGSDRSNDANNSPLTRTCFSPDPSCTTHSLPARGRKILPKHTAK